jgi:hypothetical protein
VCQNPTTSTPLNNRYSFNSTACRHALVGGLRSGAYVVQPLLASGVAC